MITPVTSSKASAVSLTRIASTYVPPAACAYGTPSMVIESAKSGSQTIPDGDIVTLLLLPPGLYAELANAAAAQGVPEEMQNSSPRVGILYTNGRRRPPVDDKSVAPTVVPPARTDPQNERSHPGNVLVIQ